MSVWFDAHLVLVQATFVGLLLALSIQFPLRMGVFSFAGVGSYAIGAYAAAITVLRWEVPGLVAVAVGALAAGLAGLPLALLLARLGGLYLGMATIAFDLILTVVATNGGDLTGGPTGLFGAIADITMAQIIGVTVVAVALLALTERGRMGRRIDAVRDDPELAASMGINVRRHRQAAFVVSGLLGGCAGAINVLLRTTVGPTDIGFGLVVLALTMIILGGARSWLGALIGAVVFTWLPSLLAVVGEWQHVIYGVIVALAAIWIPGGVLGLATDAWRGLQQRRRLRELATARPAETPAAQRGADEEELAVLEELVQETSVETQR
ncbi:MAG TPA: branched-chain amino acid ABC transporter permease [Pseudonocardiaceae bacterium]|jgi:branched-chain amino acid transport system permease protein